MRRASFVSVVTIAAFLAAGTLHPASAQTATPSSPLRASIDRQAAKAAQFPAAPVRKNPPVRRSMMQGGGGGMMMITLISTLAGLAATYFVVKELQKNNDETSAQ